MGVVSRCGDFNYRVDLPNDECKQLIAQQNWSTLLTFDQLTQERQQNKVFGGFTEAPIAFAPTYKFVMRCGEK
jgi:phosphatidylinositol-bisphosphatase